MFIFDGYRRLKSSIQEGETISKRAIILILAIYLVFLLLCVSFTIIFLDSHILAYSQDHPLAYPICLVIFDAIYVATVATLATILFRLVDERAALKRTESKFDLIVEEDLPLTYGSLNETKKIPE